MNKIPLTIKELKSNTEFNYDVFTKEALISTIVSVRDYFSDLEKENKKHKEVIDKAIEYINLIVLSETLNGEPVLFKEEAEGQYLLDVLKEVE